MMKRTKWLVLLVGVIGWALVGCDGGGENKAVDVIADTTSALELSLGEPVKVDMLVVVDASSSMCQEYGGLAKGMDAFRELAEKYLNLDIRVAVTTVNAIEDGGRFVYKPASELPLACVESKTLACLAPANGQVDSCVAAFGAGWACDLGGLQPEDMTNYNGSVNSACHFQCDGFGACCNEFCGQTFAEVCGEDAGCLAEQCGEASEGCNYKCAQAGLGVASGNGCIKEPDTASCPASVDGFLTGETLDLFHCLVNIKPSQDSTSSIEQGLRSAWLALDRAGPNAEQASGFLRDDAYLVVLFVSDEDDCSIDSEYCAPSWDCETDKDCKEIGVCKRDNDLSEIFGKETKICCGAIKKDYYGKCSLFGEYQGAAHHSKAYNLTQADCVTSADCDAGWECTSILSNVQKCRPKIFSLGGVAAFPMTTENGELADLRVGAPVFSLEPVADFHANLSGLKSDPDKLIVGVVTGDAVLKPGDPESMISDACLANAELPRCSEYVHDHGRLDHGDDLHHGHAGICHIEQGVCVVFRGHVGLSEPRCRRRLGPRQGG